MAFISTASLVVGVAAAHASHDSVLVAGIAGLVAGAMSMATGEYVSVSSQADTEQAALASAVTFTVGAALPLLVILVSAERWLI